MRRADADTDAAAAATVSGHVIAAVSSTLVPLEPAVATPVVNGNGVRQALLDKVNDLCVRRVHVTDPRQTNRAANRRRTDAHVVDGSATGVSYATARLCAHIANVRSAHTRAHNVQVLHRRMHIVTAARDGREEAGTELRCTDWTW